MKFETLPSVGSLKLPTTTGISNLRVGGICTLSVRFRALFFVLLGAYILYTFYLTAKVAIGRMRVETLFLFFVSGFY